MKKIYAKAELTLIPMDAEDIVTTSDGLSLKNWIVGEEDQAAFGDLFD